MSATAGAQTPSPDPAPTLRPDAAPTAKPRQTTPVPPSSTPVAQTAVTQTKATTTAATTAPPPRHTATRRAATRRRAAPRHHTTISLAAPMTALAHRVSTLTTPTIVTPRPADDPALLRALAGAALLALAAAGALVTRRAT